MRRELWILWLVLICSAFFAGKLFVRAIDSTNSPEPPTNAQPATEAPRPAIDVPNNQTAPHIDAPQAAEASSPASSRPALDPPARSVPYIEWVFDQAKGDGVPDATGHGYDARILGNAQLAPSWGGRQALSFDGSGDNRFWQNQPQNCGLSIGKPLDRAFDELSVEAWVRKEAATGWMPVLYRGKWDEESGFGLYMEWSSGKAVFGHYGGNGSGVGSEQVVQDGQWHEVVGVMEPAADGGHRYRIFVDGVLDAQQSGPWGVSETPLDGGILKIAYPNSSGSDLPFKGDLGRISLFDVALTPAMVKARFEAQRPLDLAR